jgi:tRNA A37 threonylcarbamoyladenosine dehydratase
LARFEKGETMEDQFRVSRIKMKLRNIERMAREINTNNLATEQELDDIIKAIDEVYAKVKTVWLK